MKLKDAIKHFLSTYPNQKTRATYGYSLDKMADYIGNRPVSDITPLDAIGYIGSLINRDGQPLSPHSINKEIKTCRVFFNWLIRFSAIDKSPFAVVKYLSTPTYTTEDKAMAHDDLDIILSRIRFMPRENALIRFLADTGARARGAGELTLDRLDTARCVATVIEKGDESRIVTFGEDTQKALVRWLALRGNLTSQLVFQASDKRSFSAEAVGQMVRRCCELAGVKPRGSHSLRHRKGHQIMATYADPSLGAIAFGNSVEIFLKNYASKNLSDALQMMQDLAIKTEQPTPPNVIPLPKTKSG